MIRLERVDKVYWEGEPSEVRALQEVDLHVARGEYVAVMGPSGSGKSTLLHVLGCLDRPTRGRYLLDGEDTSAFRDRQLSRVRNRQIGFVFQGFHLLPRETALENVMLPLVYAGRRDARKVAREALERVGLERRLRQQRSRVTVRAWDYRQRLHARGVERPAGTTGDRGARAHARGACRVCRRAPHVRGA
jgi:putative ABC transport system ATP-binding protein